MINDIIDNYRENILNDLCKIVKIPSVTQDRQSVDLVLRKIQKMYNDNGFDMRVNSEYAYSEIGNGEKTIGLFAHADVVPCNDDWTVTKPFDPLIKDGYITGRGVLDDKSAVIAILYALKAIKDADITLKNKIAVFVGGSEETGMEDIKSFTKNEKMPDVSIIPDSAFPLSIGEKGILRLICKSKKTFENITMFDGGSAFNIILGKVTVKLNTELKNTEFQTSDNALIMMGKPRHAAMPEGSVNAAVKAAEVLCGSNVLSKIDYEILNNFRIILNDYYGEALNISGEDDFGKLTCANGITKVVDKKLSFTLDIRYGTNVLSNKEIIENIKKALDDKGFEITKICEDDPGFLLDADGKIYDGLIDAYKTISGDEKAGAYKSAGGTYARYLKNSYSTGIALKSTIPSTLPDGHGDLHQSDECMNIESYINGIKIIANMIINTDKNI